MPIHFKSLRNVMLAGAFVVAVLSGCAPQREENGLPPTIYVSGTAQERLSRTLLTRTWEEIRLVHQLQYGFALPAPQRDTARMIPADSSYYVRTRGDSLSEMVRFVPDIWMNAGTRADSVIYRWEIYGGDTVNNGTYYYRIASKRLAPDSIAHLVGTVKYGQYYTAIAGDGLRYNYSYSITGTFDEPGGTPPPLAGATYRWNGGAISWESDGIPTNWILAGSSRRLETGGWTTIFTIDADTLVTASLDSMGIGTFRIGWDNFRRDYNFNPN